MKISKMEFKATIPTGQYANIQPSIEFSDITEDEAVNVREMGLDFIKGLYTRYGAGLLVEKDIKTSIDETLGD